MPRRSRSATTSCTRPTSPASRRRSRPATPTPTCRPILDYDAYRAGGGYAVLDRLRAGELSIDAILQVLDDGGLRGLGGAGFPTGRKWRSVRGEPGPRLMAVNGDEGEPGTFKDQLYLNTDPHRFLEGMLIGAHVVEADDVYIYLRDEYPIAREILAARDRQAAGRRPAHPPAPRRGRLHLRRGILAASSRLEGKRGLPRHKPPFPFQVGLFGRPTLINNVETLYWVRDLVERGAEWWKSHGRNGRVGLRSYSVSGRVKEPGVKLAPAGITIRELIDEYCGGMQRRATASRPTCRAAPRAASCRPAMGDIPLDFGTLEKYGCFIGSAAVVVLSDQDDVRGAALNLMRFFEDESCGQCTPCRTGTQKAAHADGAAASGTPSSSANSSQCMRDASICGLGQAASNPLTSVIKYFPDLFPSPLPIAAE